VTAIAIEATPAPAISPRALRDVAAMTRLFRAFEDARARVARFGPRAKRAALFAGLRPGADPRSVIVSALVMVADPALGEDLRAALIARLRDAA